MKCQDDFDKSDAEGKCVVLETTGAAMLGFPDGIKHEPSLRIEMQALSARQLYFLKYEIHPAETFNEIKKLYAARSVEIIMDICQMRELAKRLSEMGINNRIVNEQFQTTNKPV